MKNLFRYVISGFCLASILLAATSVFAAPVRLNQVVQVVNAKPGKANSGNFSQLRLVDDLVIKTDDDDDTVTATPTQDDDRMIVKKTTEIVEEEVCDCKPDPDPKKPKFPYWALGFAAVPLLFLIPGKDKTPTPTMPTTQTPTPTPNTPTPTPPEPVPEPMTLLLFGTGLAGIGIAARKKFGKKEQINTEN